MFLLISLSIGGLFSFHHAYANKILPNVSVASIDLSGKSREQATYLIKNHYQQILDREITITAVSKEIKVRLADTGLEFNIEAAVDASYLIGRDKNLWQNFFTIGKTVFKRQDIQAATQFNKEKYASFANLIVPQLNNDPQDASLKVENGQIVEIKESNGQKVDTKNLHKSLLALADNTSFGPLALNTQIIYPTLTTKNFSESKKEAEEIINKTYTLTYENFAFSPSKEEVGNWIKFSNDNGNINTEMADENINTYLNKIAPNIEIQKTNKKVNALDESVIIEGRKGRYLDKDNATIKIREQISRGNKDITVALQTYEEEPEVERVFPSEGLVPGRFEGKYIDIDLAQQKLCKIEGNVIGDCYQISSGKPSMPTPTGTFAIQNKNTRQWSGKYGLWMPFWQSFKGDYGLHELPEWPSGYKEGEAHLGTPVSHGCVRLGVGPAESLYNWTEIGTPVYIHK